VRHRFSLSRYDFTVVLRSANATLDSDRIEVRLVTKTGSLSERDDQLGYAHLLEHMAFRGTENFSLEDIESLIAGVGLRWGADVNATTHYGATIYRFSLQQDDFELLPQLFALMREWLESIKFDPEALEREKRIVYLPVLIQAVVMQIVHLPEISVAYATPQ